MQTQLPYRDPLGQGNLFSLHLVTWRIFLEPPDPIALEALDLPLPAS